MESQQGIFDLGHIDAMTQENVLFNKKGVFDLLLHGDDGHTLNVKISKGREDFHCSLYWWGRNRLQNQASVDYTSLDNVLAFMRTTAKRWSLKGLCLSAIEVMNNHRLNMKEHAIYDDNGREVCNMIGLRIKERRAVKQMIADALTDGRSLSGQIKQKIKGGILSPALTGDVVEFEFYIDSYELIIMISKGSLDLYYVEMDIFNSNNLVIASIASGCNDECNLQDQISEFVNSLDLNELSKRAEEEDAKTFEGSNKIKVNRLIGYMNHKGWDDGIVLLHGAMDKANQDNNFRKQLQTLFDDYDTITGRDIFGQYWDTLANQNAIDSIDSGFCHLWNVENGHDRPFNSDGTQEKKAD